MKTPMTVVMVTHDMREAFTLATRVVAFERLRDRPEEKIRYGATISRDIPIWPPRIAGMAIPYSTRPGRPGHTRSIAGTARPTDTEEKNRAYQTFSGRNRRQPRAL